MSVPCVVRAWVCCLIRTSVYFVCCVTRAWVFYSTPVIYVQPTDTQSLPIMSRVCHSSVRRPSLSLTVGNITTLKSLDYNVVMTFRFNNNNNKLQDSRQLYGWIINGSKSVLSLLRGFRYRGELVQRTGVYRTSPNYALTRTYRNHQTVTR